MRETVLRTQDGTNIFTRTWVSARPRRLLVCVQGLGGHGGYYRELAVHLSAHGTSVIAPDLRGHGRSDGPRGDIDRFDRYLLDIDTAVTWARKHWPSLPLFVMGESMGASLAIQYAARIHPSEPPPHLTQAPSLQGARRARSQARLSAPELAGVILVAPVLAPAIHPSTEEVVRFLAALLSKPTHPSLAVTGREEVGCRDPTFNASLQSDSLFVRQVSVRFLTQLTLWLWRTRSRAGLLRLPLLVLQGGQDKIARPSSTAAFLRRVPSEALQVKLFPRAYHCLLHDPDTAAVLEFLSTWLAASSRS